MSETYYDYNRIAKIKDGRRKWLQLQQASPSLERKKTIMKARTYQITLSHKKIDLEHRGFGEWYGNNKIIQNKQLLKMLNNYFEICIYDEIFYKIFKISIQTSKNIFSYIGDVKECLVISYINKWCHRLSNIWFDVKYEEIMNLFKTYTNLKQKQQTIKSKLLSITNSYEILRDTNMSNWSKVQNELFITKQNYLKQNKSLSKQISNLFANYEYMKTYNFKKTLQFNRMNISSKIALIFHFQYNSNQEYLNKIFYGINVKKSRVYLIRQLVGKSGFGIKFTKSSLQDPITPINIITILRELNQNYIKNKLNITTKDWDWEGKWEEFEIVLFQIMLFVSYKNNVGIKKRIKMVDLLTECDKRNIECNERIRQYHTIDSKHTFIITNKNMIEFFEVC